MSCLMARSTAARGPDRWGAARARKDIAASEIEVVSNDGFVLGGLFTYINPSSPQPATEADLYLRHELPD
jgi:hypothetical protein